MYACCLNNVLDVETMGRSPLIAVEQLIMEAELISRCITRDLKWGTPVPLEGYKDKVFYVW